jgi:hypothetical protein
VTDVDYTGLMTREESMIHDGEGGREQQASETERYIPPRTGASPIKQVTKYRIKTHQKLGNQI